MSTSQDTIRCIRNEFEGAVRRAGTLPDLVLPADQPTNFVTGRPVVRDESQLVSLSVAAAAEGYKSNRWATLKQIRANGGSVDKNEFGAPMFMTMGSSLRYYRVYNYDVVKWENGEPNEFSAPKRPRKAATPKRTTSPRKPKASAGTVTIKLPNGAVVTCAPQDVAMIMAAMC